MDPRAAILALLFCLAPALAPAQGTPPVGVNLEGLSDHSRFLPFVDLMKTARRWGDADAPWKHTVRVDAAGWPLEDAGVVVRVITRDEGAGGAAGGYLRPGTYKLSFRGKARVAAIHSAGTRLENDRFDPRTGLSTADVVVAAGARQLMLSFKETDGGVRDVSLRQPGYREGATFTDEYLAAIAPFRVLRFMSFTATNHLPAARWSGRPLASQATQAGAGGVAWEYVIGLANAAKKDVWINIPYGADDAYVRELATMLRDGLDPSLSIYVEVANELWNYTFRAATLNLQDAAREAADGDVSLTNGTRCSAQELAANRGDCNRYWAASYRIGKLLSNASAVFAQVFGKAQMGTRVRPVLATQFANPAMAEGILKNYARYRGRPRDTLYGIASAPYVYLAPEISRDDGASVADILASLEAGLHQVLPLFDTGLGRGAGLRRGEPYQPTQRWSEPTQKALADFYGLKSLAYEGGLDFRQERHALAAKYRSNFDPRMGEMVRLLLQQWYGCGNALFVYFALSSSFDHNGYWGLINDAYGARDAPKYRAVVDAIDGGFTAACR